MQPLTQFISRFLASFIIVFYSAIKMMGKRGLFFVCILIIFVVETAEGSVTFEEDIRLTKKEAAAFQKFKERVRPKIKLDYQKEDLFLLRHLRAYKFEVSKAEEFLFKNLKWREENNMETIHEEDWSDIERDYPMRVEGHDRFGRPLIIWDLGDWDIRKAALAGKMDRIVRWTMKNWDMGRRKVRELELKNRNVTRFTMVLDLKNINPVTNVNPATLPYYLTCALAWEDHFPKWGNNVWLLNTPGIFETVLSLVRPVLSKETNENLLVHGKNPEEWKPILHKEVDPHELPQRYGGKKEDPH